MKIKLLDCWCTNESLASNVIKQNATIEDRELEFLKSADLVDLVKKGYIVYAVLANAGDMVVFPQGWLHRVQTYQKSIGCGGYI